MFCVCGVQGLINWFTVLAPEISRFAEGRKICIVTDSTLTAHDYVVQQSAAQLGGA